MRRMAREQRVICSRCRYIFSIDIPTNESLDPVRVWRAEAECPSCESVQTFTHVDTPEAEVNKKPKPTEPSEEWQKEVAKLFQPIHEHEYHPAVRWFDSIGNMWYSDDCSPCPFSTTWLIYRFRWKQ